MSVSEVKLSDQKPQRTQKEIQEEYANLIFKSGNLQYEISQKQKDLELLNKVLRDLAFEFSKAPAALVAEAPNASS